MKFRLKKLPLLLASAFIASSFNAYCAEVIIAGGEVREVNTLWDLGATNASLLVGKTTSGTLNVSSGGVVKSNLLNIGRTGGSGVVNVTGGGRIEINLTSYAYPLTVGGAGSDGSLASGTQGHLTISGSGSEIFISGTGPGELSVGSEGAHGYMRIENGGKFTAEKSPFYVGSRGGNTTQGEIEVDGAGSTLFVKERILVGTYNQAKVTVTNGGNVTSNEYITVGRTVETGVFDSLLEVSGSGSVVQASQAGGYIQAGYSGRGTIVASDQGTLISNEVSIAGNAGSVGELAIGAREGDAAKAPGIVQANQVRFGSGTGKLVFNHTDTNYQFSTNIIGAGTVRLLSGVTTLFGANTYTGGTVVEAAATLKGNTTSLQGNIVNNGSVVFDQTTSDIYSGNITGTGSFTKTGNEVLTLSGTNSYTGGTTVNAGTLKGNTISLQGNIVNNGAVIVEQATDGVYGGNITGTGSFTKNSNNILTLSGVNSYSGGTTVSAGTLKGNTSSLQGDISNNSTVWFNQDVDGVYTGTLSGIGDILKDGAGTMTLAGNASQSMLNVTQGGLYVTADKTLTLSSAATFSTGTTLGVAASNNTGLIANSLVLQGNNVLDVTGYAPKTDGNTYTLVQTQNGITGELAYTIAGQPLRDYVDLDTFMIGSAQKDSSGKNIIAQVGLVWENQEAASAHGTFYVDSGKNFTLSSDLSNSTNISAHGFGWDGTTLDKRGAGTLLLDGVNTYTGITEIQEGQLIVGSSLANNNATISGDVNVQTGATLGGHGQILGHVHLLDGSTISPGNSIGSLTVGDITFDSGSTYEFEANQDGTADKINATGTATINGGTVNVKANGNIWSTTDIYTILTADTAVAGAYTGLTSNLTFLDAQLSYDANNVYLQFVRNDTSMMFIGNTFNEINTGYGIESLGAGNPLYDTIVSMDRFSALSAYNNLSGEIHASATSALLSNSSYVRAGVNQRLTSQLPELGNNLWVQSWTHSGRMKTDGNADRLNNNGYGILLGIDRPVSEHVQIGVAAGYEQTTAKTQDLRQSQADIDAYHIMLYGKTKAGYIDLRGGVGYTHFKFDTRRNIWVNGLQGQNTARYNGYQLQTFVEGSHTFSLNEQTSVTPYLNLGYAQVKTQSFTERGNATALVGQSQTHGMGSITLGVRGEMTLGAQQQHSLYADLGVINRFGSKTPQSELSFIGGMPYTVKGINQGRTGALVGLGTNLQIKPNMNLMLGYEGELSSSIKDHSFKAQLEWRF